MENNSEQNSSYQDKINDMIKSIESASHHQCSCCNINKNINYQDIEVLFNKIKESTKDPKNQHRI